ncbi:receptor like protein 29-like [Vicia villosa]|uniref:receptor like protein 29-like n=1 Tax=Vicia villosa TaxID=3911 RepID=UPI00273BD9D2|nr:receptor like protein 29-like [Vicia villosa]
MDDSILKLAVIWLAFILFVVFPPENQPSIDPLEQNAVYRLLNSLNPTLPWTTLYPNDLCISPPHFLLCDSQSHIVAITSPPCSPNATLNDPLLFTPFTHLRKLTFSKCFNNSLNPIHSLPSLPPSLQQLILIDNPSILSPLQPFLHNLTSLKKLVLTGNGFHGQLPPQIGLFPNLVELNLSRNNLSGELPATIGRLKKLKILDLSGNDFKGSVPEQVGNLVSLSKLNLSHNEFTGKIPESFIQLKNIKYFDLSFNRFGKFGVPLFLSEFTKMKEVYLSGNKLSGEIPEIWEKLDRLEKIGFSDMDLVGKIPVSMFFYLENLSYLALDNNNLHGRIPDGFWYLAPYVEEINLENNNLSQTMALTCGAEIMLNKLKLAGNVGMRLKISNRGCSSCPKYGCGGVYGSYKRTDEW